MSWAYEQAVQLLNDAKLAGDTVSKVVRTACVAHCTLRSTRRSNPRRVPSQHLLQQLSELLFRKEPALIPQFSVALLELQVRGSAVRQRGCAGFLTPSQAEPTTAVRKFLATVLEPLAGSSVQLVAPCVAAAICLLRVRRARVPKSRRVAVSSRARGRTRANCRTRKPPSSRRRCCQALACFGSPSCWRASRRARRAQLRVPPVRGRSRAGAAQQGAGVPQPEVVAAWSASRALFAEACGLAVGSENSGVKLQAVKFVEAAALAYSAALSVPALLSPPLASELHDGLRVSLGAPRLS